MPIISVNAVKSLLSRFAEYPAGTTVAFFTLKNNFGFVESALELKSALAAATELYTPKEYEVFLLF